MARAHTNGRATNDKTRSGKRSATGRRSPEKKAAGRRTEGPIELLERQHREVERLFDQLESTSGKRASDLFARVADMLAIHASIEEEHFYPTVAREDSDLEEELRKALEEHLAVKRVITDLLRTGPGDETFMPKIQVLKELVMHHVEEEQDELFPKVRKLVDADLMDELGREMREMVSELQRGGEPRREVPSQIASAPALL